MARTNFGIPSANLPGNLYGGGAVVFNSQPYVSYYLQQQAHKQAQEDAFYKYFGDLSKNLTPAGMHTKDIPTLMQKKNEWQQFDMQNRKAIARPGLDQGKAYAESMSRYNDMMSLINQSKNDVKNLASLKPILDSPQKNALLNDATMLRIRHGSLPIGHPDYQPFDPNSISYNPPPFDAKQANSFRNILTQYKPQEGEPTIVNLPHHQQQVTHNFKFNEGQLSGIYGQAASQYHSNPSFMNMINAQTSPEQYNANNSLFKEHFGRDINSQEDMAAAYMLGLHPDVAQKTEIRNIPYSPSETAAAGLGREEDYFDYRERHKREVEAQLDDQAEKFLAGREKEAKAGGAFPYTHGETGKKENAYNVGLAPDQIKKIFSIRDISGKHTLTPDKVQVLESGDYLPIYYQYKDGKPIGSDKNYAVDQRYTKPVSREAVKASLISNKIVGKPQAAAPAQPAQTHIKKVSFGTGGLN